MRNNVKCKSGRIGWQGRLHEVYTTINELKACDAVYGILQRIGFKSAERAWKVNPIIQGSVSPSDLCRVPEKRRK